MRGSVSAVLLGLAAAVAGATDYHVALDGSDGNPGTSEAPWRTIQHAVENVAAGDRILVHAGTYVGARIEASGTPEATITLMAAPGEAVLLDEPGPGNQHDSILEVETWEEPLIVAWWTIEGFEIAGSPRYGIDSRGVHHITVRGNVVHDSVLTGIFDGFAAVLRQRRAADGRPVAANLIHGNGQGGGSGINLDGVSDSAVINNLVYGEHASGISLYRVDGAECSSDNLVAHNTVLTLAAGRWALNMETPGCTGNRIYDNVLWSDQDFRGSISLWDDQPPGFESDRNAVTDRFSVDGGETTISFPEWQALGHDAGSFLSTPQDLFVDPAGGDFHLAPGSAAIDTGLTLAEVPIDLEGNPRPQGAASDIGCYESGDHLFADDFESGDTGAWDQTVPD